jgi:hypothetical protein
VPFSAFARGFTRALQWKPSLSGFGQELRPAGSQLADLRSIDFVVGPHGLKKDGFSSLVLHELKDYTEVETGAARPQARERTLQLVGSQTQIEDVFGESLEGLLNIPSHLRMFSDGPFGGSEKGWRRDQSPLQEPIAFRIS